MGADEWEAGTEGKLKPLGSPWKRKKTTFCAKQMKDICIYALVMGGQKELTQAAKSKAF